MPLLRHVDDPRTLALAYCANVDPAESVDALERSIDSLWAPVQRRVAAGRRLGVGLWLPATLAAELAGDARRARGLRSRLLDHGLFVFTANAFPYGGFHAERVKHEVYRPAWWDARRARQTLDAAEALAALLPDDMAYGTISTVPLGWRGDLAEAGARAVAAGAHLARVALALGRLEERTGKHVRVLLEPEPGCALETTADAIALWQTLVGGDGEVGRDVVDAAGGGGDGDAARAAMRRHLGVCFDCCHQAVMGEELDRSLHSLSRAGVPVGKLHLSSALEGPLEALERYAEPRYLHQTFTLPAAAGAPPAARADDLPGALVLPAMQGRRVRTHFHVPIHVDRLPGGLSTTGAALPAALRQALKSARPAEPLPHLEVETYTWAVLPDPPSDRVEGIARELDHALALLAELGWR